MFLDVVFCAFMKLNLFDEKKKTNYQRFKRIAREKKIVKIGTEKTDLRST